MEDNNYEFWEEYLDKIKIKIKEMCLKKKKMYIDFHMHSNYSADGKQDLKQILKTTKQKGFDIIAITDHDSIDVYDELYNIVKNKLTKPLIIPGVELTIDNKEYGNQCHLLQLFINPKDMELRKNIKKNYQAMFKRSKIQFQRIKENKALQEIFKKNDIKVSQNEFFKYLNKNNLVPEYDTLSFYIMDKLKQKCINTFNVLNLLEKYNNEDIYEDRKNYKDRRYKKLKDKYKEVEENYYNSRFLLSMLAVREVDDDWWDRPSSGSLSVNSYGQMKVDEITNKYKIFFAHPTEKSLKTVEKIIKNNKNIIGLEENIRNQYININNFYDIISKYNLLRIIGSDSHDDKCTYYNNMEYYLIDSEYLLNIIKKI